MTEIILIAHNIRSWTHNVGAFFRTSDGFGVSKIILSGYTPYPTLEDDNACQDFADKLTRQIHKTALGAETMVPLERHEEPPFAATKRRRLPHYGLEQGEDAVLLPEYKNPAKVALLLGMKLTASTQKCAYSTYRRNPHEW